MRARKPWVCLAKGDCLQLMDAIPNGSIDMVVCDPPYGVTALDWDRKIEAAPLWREYQRVAKENAVIALFGQQPFCTELAAAAPRNLLRYEWVWDKGAVTGFGNARRMPLRRHENVLVFYRRLPTYNPQGLRACHSRCRPRSKSDVYDMGAREAYVQRQTGYPQSILHFKRDRGSSACQKPVALLEYLIRTYTNPGETVLDNAMGLGSAGVAALQTERNFIGMEMDGERFHQAAARITETMHRIRGCRMRTLKGDRDA